MQTGTSVIPVRGRKASPVKAGPGSRALPAYRAAAPGGELGVIWSMSVWKESDQAGVGKGMEVFP